MDFYHLPENIKNIIASVLDSLKTAFKKGVHEPGEYLEMGLQRQ